MDQKIPKSTTDPISYIKGTYNVNLFLKPTDKEEIAKTITNLKDGSPGEDGIPSKIYKVSKPFISNTLAFLVNLSLSQHIDYLRPPVFRRQVRNTRYGGATVTGEGCIQWLTSSCRRGVTPLFVFLHRGSKNRPIWLNFFLLERYLYKECHREVKITET